MRSAALIALLLLTGCPKKDETSTDSGAAPSPSAATPAVTGAAATGLSLLGDKIFSGQVDFTIKNEKGTGNASIMIKGQKQRMEMHMPDAPSQAMSAIIDGEAKKMIMLDDARRTAMVMTINENGKPTGTSAGVTTGQGANVKDHEYKNTGKKDVVAGYACDIWTYEEPDEKGEICAANGLTLLGASTLGAMASALSSKMTGFPLRAIAQTKEGKEKSRMEVTKLERTDVADDKFVVPPGYKTMSMDDLMKGLGGIPRK